MAFELFIQSSDAAVTKTAAGSCSVVTPIGIDLDKSSFYTLTVSIAPMAGAGIYELVFYITEIHQDIDRETSEDAFSGRETSYISKDERAEILRVVLENLSVLISLSDADSIMMYAPDEMPAKAFVKYEKICARFVDLGYSVETFPPLLGTRSWRFDKMSLFLA